MHVADSSSVTNYEATLMELVHPSGFRGQLDGSCRTESRSCIGAENRVSGSMQRRICQVLQPPSLSIGPANSGNCATGRGKQVTARLLDHIWMGCLGTTPNSRAWTTVLCTLHNALPGERRNGGREISALEKAQQSHAPWIGLSVELGRLQLKERMRVSPHFHLVLFFLFSFFLSAGLEVFMFTLHAGPRKQDPHQSKF